MKDQDVRCVGNHIEGKSIAYIVSDSIARIMTPIIARQFRQYGGEQGVNIDVFLTPSAYRKADLEAIMWATGNKPIGELTAEVEHLKEYDAYVIAPATYDVIGKFANGIADNAATTTFAVAMGRKERYGTPIMLAPAMHGDMDNSICKENIERLISKGVNVIEPDYCDGKAKLADPKTIVAKTIREMSRSSAKGKRILVTAGPTPGKIDDVRMIITKFTGETGVMIADEAYMRGADVELIAGPLRVPIPRYISHIGIKDYHEYHVDVMKTLNENRFDAAIFSAAVADYVPRNPVKGKIPSQGGMSSIDMMETAKVIKEVRKEHPELFMVTFKYEEGVSHEQLLDIGRKRAMEGYEIVVANRAEEITLENHPAIIMGKEGVVKNTVSKQDTASSLMDIIEEEVV